jgi:hypothetical protein
VREIATVTSIVARCLTEPDFLSVLCSRPSEALAGYPLADRTRRDFLTLDVDRIRRFGGLITKVQHNYLWEGFAGTLYLTKHFGIELSAFAEYRGAIGGQPRPDTREQRTAAFLDFLSTYIARHGPRRWAALRAVLTHERHTWSVANEVAASQHPSRPAAETASTKGCVPRFAGPVHLEEYACDPHALIDQARQGRCHPLRSRLCHRFVYWGNPETQTVHVLTVDRDTFRVLGYIDGRRSVAQLCTVAGRAARLSSERCLLLLSRAHALGLIHMQYSKRRNKNAGHE